MSHMHNTNKHTRCWMWIAVGLFLFLVCLTMWNYQRLQDINEQEQIVYELDKCIVQDVEQALTAKLLNMTEADEITKIYGKFIRLTDVHWSRPNYFGQLVVRLDFSATAHFQKAQVPVNLGITEPLPPMPKPNSEGNTSRQQQANPSDDLSQDIAITSLQMVPSEQSIQELISNGRELKIIDNRFWLVHKDRSRGVIIIEGWANHQDFTSK